MVNTTINITLEKLMYGIQLVRKSKFSLTRQLYDQLRNLILNSELKAGQKLPSSRNLSVELKISRIIVVKVFEQLLAEGYLETKKGAGTYVAKGAFLQDYKKVGSQKKLNISKAIKRANKDDDQVISFTVGIPDLSLFPLRLWAKILKEAYQFAHISHYNYGYPGGVPELKEKLPDYLLRTKGIRCYPEQIMILAGSSQCILTAVKLMSRKATQVIVEDPSYCGVHKILKNNSLQLLPIPVDEDGIQADMIPNGIEHSSMIITPSHQVPLGIILSIQRRIKLIEIARKNNCYIIENDYDSEFRYTGNTVQALHFLDPKRVIHIGTFSETLYPSIRLGYLIVPEHLVEACISVINENEFAVPALNQLALATFIEEGYFEKHLSKMKKVYYMKRKLLCSLLDKEFGSGVRIFGDATGLFITISFPNLEWNKRALEVMVKYQLNCDFAENHAIKKGRHKNKIMLGFGNLSFDQIKEGVERLKKIVVELLKSTGAVE